MSFVSGDSFIKSLFDRTLSDDNYCRVLECSRYSCSKDSWTCVGLRDAAERSLGSPVAGTSDIRAARRPACAAAP